jgi:hypothetical protein
MISKIPFLLTFLICFGSFSQNNIKFEIITLGNKYSVEEISYAFTNADLCGYYKQDSNTEFILDDSSVIRLKNKEYLVQNSIILNSDCFDVKSIKSDQEIWRISNSVLVCERYKSNAKYLKN